MHDIRKQVYNNFSQHSRDIHRVYFSCFFWFFCFFFGFSFYAFRRAELYKQFNKHANIWANIFSALPIWKKNMIQTLTISFIIKICNYTADAVFQSTISSFTRVAPIKIDRQMTCIFKCYVACLCVCLSWGAWWIKHDFSIRMNKRKGDAGHVGKAELMWMWELVLEKRAILCVKRGTCRKRDRICVRDR